MAGRGRPGPAPLANRQMMSMRIRTDVCERVDHLAAEAGITRSALINAYLATFVGLDPVESIEPVQAADQLPLERSA